jgi:hypothetical protein
VIGHATTRPDLRPGTLRPLRQQIAVQGMAARLERRLLPTIAALG